MLRGKEKITRFEKAKTIEKAVASEADILVLVLPKRELPKLEKGTLEALKKRRSSASVSRGDSGHLAWRLTAAIVPMASPDRRAS